MPPIRIGPNPSSLIPIQASMPVGAIRLQPRAALEKAGISKWVEHEVAPALHVRVRRGFDVNIENVGTPGAPAWKITPKEEAQSGLLPLIPLVRTVTRAVHHRQGHHADADLTDPWGQSAASGGMATQEGHNWEGEAAIGLARQPGVGAVYQDPGQYDPLHMIDSDGLSHRLR